MEKHDLAQFSHLMLSIGKLYSKDLSRDCLEIFWSSLKTYSIQSVRLALQEHIQDKKGGRFFPTPADILLRLQGDDESKAFSAWDNVIRAIAHTGSYGNVTFDDPLTACVLREMGGWIRLCRSKESDFVFKQQQFISKYQNYLKKPPAHLSNASQSFLGIASLHNGEHRELMGEKTKLVAKGAYQFTHQVNHKKEVKP